MAKLVWAREISPAELVEAHREQIRKINPQLNAVVALLDEALIESDGPLAGVPFSAKDSIDVRGVRTTAGTLERRNAAAAERDATVVRRLRAAGGVPIAKTNVPDLLYSFECDNLIFGRSNNPYDLTRTPGGSSGGEAALIAACGSPLGLGSDCLGSVRVPAAFCGIASIKPTSGRLPRTGHVPPASGWVEALWQIGPMARHVEDLVLAMRLLASEDEEDFTSPPIPLFEFQKGRDLRLAFFTDNGFARCEPEIVAAVRQCAQFFSQSGIQVEERRPPGLDEAYELELALLGADGVEGIGSTDVHPFLTHFVEKMRVHRARGAELAKRWYQWDECRRNLRRFFREYDAILCPVYTQVALKHGESILEENFRGFSYTMAWSVAGAPAATVRCASHEGLPVNVQIVAKPWNDMLALEIARAIEERFGGWQPA
ncbi:MAG TPA: amidase [Bryobacteraceae bacterium]|jgi:amidase